MISSSGAAAATTSVRLSWDANSEPDLAGYILHYGTAPGVHNASIDVGNVTSYQIDDLPEGVVYYFAAVAYDLSGNRSNKSNEIAVLPSAPAPALHISASGSPDPVPAGDLLTYSFEYSNSGTTAASGVVIATSIPGDTTFVSATGGQMPTGSMVTWSVGSLPAGASGTVHMVVRVTSPLPNGTLIFNGGYTIDSDETSPVGGGTIHTTVTSAPILQVSKTRIPDLVRAGDFFTYRIAYSNVGNATATDVTIIDILPPDTAYIWATEGGSHQTGTGHWLAWLRGTLPPGTTEFVHEIVRLRSPLPVGSLITSAGVVIVSNETAPVFSLPDMAHVSPPAPPRLGDVIDGQTGLNSVLAGGVHRIRVTGNGFLQGAQVDLGPDIVVDETTWVSFNRLDVQIAVGPGAPRGPRSLTVTNPDLGAATLIDAVEVVFSPDLNQDCRLDGNDFIVIGGSLDHTLGEPEFKDRADLDGNGSVDPADLALFLIYIGKPLPTCPAW